MRHAWPWQLLVITVKPAQLPLRNYSDACIITIRALEGQRPRLRGEPRLATGFPGPWDAAGERREPVEKQGGRAIARRATGVLTKALWRGPMRARLTAGALTPAPSCERVRAGGGRSAFPVSSAGACRQVGRAWERGCYRAANGEKKTSRPRLDVGPGYRVVMFRSRRAAPLRRPNPPRPRKPIASSVQVAGSGTPATLRSTEFGAPLTKLLTTVRSR
jgi:hypothetical protein